MFMHEGASPREKKCAFASGQQEGEGRDCPVPLRAVSLTQHLLCLHTPAVHVLSLLLSHVSVQLSVLLADFGPNQASSLSE